MTGTVVMLEPGLLVTVQGERGLFRFVEPCASGSGCGWFLPVDHSGVDRGTGWRAFRPDECRPVSKRKAAR